MSALRYSPSGALELPEYPRVTTGFGVVEAEADADSDATAEAYSLGAAVDDADALASLVAC